MVKWKGVELIVGGWVVGRGSLGQGRESSCVFIGVGMVAVEDIDGIVEEGVHLTYFFIFFFTYSTVLQFRIFIQLHSSIFILILLSFKFSRSVLAPIFLFFYWSYESFMVCTLVLLLVV